MKHEKKKPVGRPPSCKVPKSTAEVGTKQEDMRKTYIVNIDQAEKNEAIAYWDRQTVKEVVGEAFDDRIKKLEKNVAVKAKPKK